MTNELLPSTAMVTPREQRGKNPGRTSAVIGVAAIVVIAVAATIAIVSARNAEGSGDPSFVLPVPSDGWQLSGGVVAEPSGEPPGTSERFITRGRLFGVVDDDAYVDLRSEVIYDESPLAGHRWDEVDTVYGDAHRRADDSITIAQPLVDGWQVVSSPDDLVHVYDLMGNSIADSLVLIATFSPGTATAPTTSFEMTSSDGSTFRVRTSASESPLFGVATFAERVERVDINGRSGWIITDELDEGTQTTIAWSPDSGGTVTVRSTAPPAAVVDAARQLRPVSEDEWAAAIPDAQLD